MIEFDKRNGLGADTITGFGGVGTEGSEDSEIRAEHVEDVCSKTQSLEEEDWLGEEVLRATLSTNKECTLNTESELPDEYDSDYNFNNAETGNEGVGGADDYAAESDLEEVVVDTDVETHDPSSEDSEDPDYNVELFRPANYESAHYIDSDYTSDELPSDCELKIKFLYKINGQLSNQIRCQRNSSLKLGCNFKV